MLSSSHHGSSPRARGTAGSEPRAASAERFIPARAGNGSGVGRAGAPSTVHPRARGEREPGEKLPEPMFGSSPRARGTGKEAKERQFFKRFIPARAGNGGLGIVNVTASPVHPRARGERGGEKGRDPPENGSSPRARGTADGATDAPLLIRFIPARAGNGASRQKRRVDAAVHPRARGERIEAQMHARRLDGSSPRARGTVATGWGATTSQRFIPARAGNGFR